MIDLDFLLRVSGASQIGLALAHVALWRALGWKEECARLSPLGARVFVVHTFFVCFVLCALGLLSFERADLLLVPSELGRLLVGAIVAFWALRLVMQPLVFDVAMRTGPTRSLWVRVGSTLLWAAYTGLYAIALLRQLEPLHAQYIR